MFIGDLAVAHLALTLGAQERWIDQDEATKKLRTSTRHHRRGHAAHRVAKQNRTRELEALERARHRSPAGAAAHQSMEQNDTWFGTSGSEVADADVVRFANANGPSRHRVYATEPTRHRVSAAWRFRRGAIA